MKGAVLALGLTTAAILANKPKEPQFEQESVITQVTKDVLATNLALQKASLERKGLEY